VLAALREIYDGAWTRHVGSDGGKTLTWRGKLGLIFCATEVYDAHYSVIGSLGDRFLLCRLEPDTDKQFDKALIHTGAATTVMRAELAEAVAKLFPEKLPEPRRLDSSEQSRLERLVRLVVRLRGGVERDRRTRELEYIYGAEGTGRLGLSLERLLAGLDTLGLERDIAFSVVKRVAMASTPPVRRRAYEALITHPMTTQRVADKLRLPKTTAKRALEELVAHGLVVRTRDEGGADKWRRTTDAD
jgi:MarR family